MRETSIETGKIRGVPCGWPGTTVYYGIPYAAPPVGKLRWRPPRPPVGWEGVRDCSRPSAICPQPRPGINGRKEFYPIEEVMSEDCLYLNVWTPAQSSEERLPVLFWIHGGAFMTGYGHSSHFGGERFCRQGIILVTINYRLNIFGWMTHPELSQENENGISGNYGLLDQLYALEWVKRNIHAFGGDPNRITVAGQSAGAMSVNCLLHTPAAKGNFCGAIMQSGGGLLGFPDMTHYRTLEESQTMSQKNMEELLGVRTIAQARDLPWQELLAHCLKNAGRPGLQLCPVIDGHLLKQPLHEAALEGKNAPVPTLLGYTAQENIPTLPTQEIFQAVMRKDMGEKAEEFFTLCPLEDEREWDTFKFSFCTELLRSSCQAWAELVEHQGHPPAYVYTLSRSLPGDSAGAFHGSDLTYVFHTLMRGWRPWTGQDYELSVAMNTYWANFVKYGTPNGNNGINDMQLPAWLPYTSQSRLTMEFGDHWMGMKQLPESRRVSYRTQALYTTHVRERC